MNHITEKKISNCLVLKDLELKVDNDNKLLFANKKIKSKFIKRGKFGGQDDYFDNLSKGLYRRNGRSGERCWKFILKYFILAKQIFSKANSDKMLAIADIGCGPGYLGRILETNTNDEKIFYVGMDLLSNKLERNVSVELEEEKKKNNILLSYISHDITHNFPLKSKRFDFAVSYQVIKYLTKKDTIKVIKEMGRILKSDGWLHISTDPFPIKGGSVIGRKQFKDKGYKSFWSKQEFIGVLRKNGFKNIVVMGAETHYNHLSKIKKEIDKDIIKKFTDIFPLEIAEAILGFFYPDNSSTLLFIAQKM